VRHIMAQLSEAEVSGDDAAVRRLQALLEDRCTIPACALIFHEDARPGYYGTSTKTSRFIGPRTPFAKDSVALDYSYDSGEEWDGEEEVAGDDVHDGDNDDDDADSDERDSDLDSWLVDDDDEEVAEGANGEVDSPLSEGMARSPSPFAVSPLPLPPKKRKAEKTQGPSGEKEKKRKTVVPLVPFNKGPCWEREIGLCEYEPFEQYRIEMFNGMARRIVLTRRIVQTLRARSTHSLLFRSRWSRHSEKRRSSLRSRIRARCLPPA
jgi:chromatin assembly factor 1 subunit A